MATNVPCGPAAAARHAAPPHAAAFSQPALGVFGMAARGCEAVGGAAAVPHTTRSGAVRVPGAPFGHPADGADRVASGGTRQTWCRGSGCVGCGAYGTGADGRALLSVGAPHRRAAAAPTSTAELAGRGCRGLAAARAGGVAVCRIVQPSGARAAVPGDVLLDQAHADEHVDSVAAAGAGAGAAPPGAHTSGARPFCALSRQGLGGVAHSGHGAGVAGDAAAACAAPAAAARAPGVRQRGAAWRVASCRRGQVWDGVGGGPRAAARVAGVEGSCRAAGGRAAEGGALPASAVPAHAGCVHAVVVLRCVASEARRRRGDWADVPSPGPR